MYSPRNKSIRSGRKFFFLFPLIFVLVFSAIVMLLWNAILPGLVQVNRISYFEAAGLLILCRILFGGLSFGGKGGPPFGGPSAHLRQKWMNMSPEEKQKFKDEWKSRCNPRKQKPD